MIDCRKIVSYMHCGVCVSEFQTSDVGVGQSMQDYADLSVGFTKEGIQVVCNRHELNVAHIDFQGQKHPACLDITGILN